MNRYVLEDEEPIPILKIDPALEQKQIDRLAAVKAGRDSAQVEARLAALKEAAARDGREPHAADHRRVPRLRHSRRDVRRAPRRVGRVARDPGLLSHERSTVTTVHGNGRSIRRTDPYSETSRRNSRADQWLIWPGVFPSARTSRPARR